MEVTLPTTRTLLICLMGSVLLYVINNPTSHFGWYRATRRMYLVTPGSIREDGRPNYKELVAGSYRSRWAGVALLMGVVPAHEVGPIHLAWVYGVAIALSSAVAGFCLHRKFELAEIAKLRAHLVSEVRRRRQRSESGV